LVAVEVRLEHLEMQVQQEVEVVQELLAAVVVELH
tara:strand:+ start:429 stop:533 length:105 start_codon:yes stop_codon:yes gene_type:complete